jgi:hypothetical protein
MPGSLFAIILAGVAAAASEPPDTVDRGVIRVGRGAAGVTFGMTAAQPRAKLGTPMRVDSFGGLSYQHNGAGTFYLHLDPRKDSRITVRFPRSSAWTLENGIKVFRPHAIPKMFRAYGEHRMRKVYDGETGWRIYQISRWDHRHNARFRVSTVFYVTRFNPDKARVYTVELYSTRCRPSPRSCFKP